MRKVRRVLITHHLKWNPETDRGYDCIYTNKSGHIDLLVEWCDHNPECTDPTLPFEIAIRDWSLMDDFVGEFKKLASYKNTPKCFKDIQGIYTAEGEKIGWIHQILKLSEG